jgi:hypothetical protein
MELREIIRRAVEIGERTGFITFKQLNELCPLEVGPAPEVGPEVIKQLFAALSENDIRVVEDDA